MKQGTLTSIAATMMQDFARTAEAAEKEQAALHQDNVDAIRLALIVKAQEEELIQAKQREAAELIAESMAMKESADADFARAMEGILRQAEAHTKDRIADAGKLKLIAGKKAA